MCFSNLPIEFDEDGNPYLAAEADDVDRPTVSADDSAPSCDCDGETDDVALDDADPEAMYEEILETMPSDVREQLADSGGRTGDRGKSASSASGRTESDRPSAIRREPDRTHSGHTD